jgi:hypothetical protein
LNNGILTVDVKAGTTVKELPGRVPINSGKRCLEMRKLWHDIQAHVSEGARCWNSALPVVFSGLFSAWLVRRSP